MLFAVAATGCTDNGIGRKCISTIGDGGAGQGTQLSSPALECPTRLCLIQNATARATCTMPCTTDDDCKDAITGSASDGLCDTNFVCAIATVVGSFACKSICICKGDLTCGFNSDSMGNTTIPQPCPNATVPAPTCSLPLVDEPICRLPPASAATAG
jgi:hypothetical protein